MAHDCGCCEEQHCSLKNTINVIDHSATVCIGTVKLSSVNKSFTDFMTLICKLLAIIAIKKRVIV